MTLNYKMTLELKHTHKHRLPGTTPSPQGFSLVELMVTIALIGILGTIASPYLMSWGPNYKLKGAAQNLYSSFQKARLEGAKRSTNIGITFNLATNSYQVFVDDGAGAGGNSGNATRDGTEIILLNRTLPSTCSFVTASFASSGARTGYNSRALPLGARIGTVVLKNNQSRRYELALSLAGHVRMRISTDNGVNWK